MDTQNITAAIVAFIGILSGIYKLFIEPSIDAKIANLETKGFLLVDNSNERLGERLTAIDRKLDIHLQDFVNYKDAILLQGRGLDDKINHTWNKTKELLTEHKTEIKDIQVSLQKQHEIKNRE